MGANSKIQWTDHTFNPWWGCVKVSPECDNCYAETFSKRTGFKVWGKNTERRQFGDKHWNEPLKWDRDAKAEGVRRRVFCGSMCDVMEDTTDVSVHIYHRPRLYDLVERTPNLDWLLLTKRPQNFQRYLLQTWLKSPRPNVWGMTTVGLRSSDWRIHNLIETPFAVRGLSCEPLLGPVNLPMRAYGTIHWVIVGGESGHGARPMDLDWARALRDQCKGAGIAFFMKQICERGRPIPFEQFPDDLQIREFPR